MQEETSWRALPPSENFDADELASLTLFEGLIPYDVMDFAAVDFLVGAYKLPVKKFDSKVVDVLVHPTDQETARGWLNANGWKQQEASQIFVHADKQKSVFMIPDDTKWLEHPAGCFRCKVDLQGHRFWISEDDFEAFLKGQFYPHVYDQIARGVFKDLQEHGWTRLPAVQMDSFLVRQFDKTNPKGAPMSGLVPETWIQWLDEQIVSGKAKLVPGYADFCYEVHFDENLFEEIKDTVVEMPKDESKIRTRYVQRRPGEIPVLERYLPFSGPFKKTKSFYVELYKLWQIDFENGGKKHADRRSPWQAIAVKTAPMLPITIMRNALGPAQGGSGYPIVKERCDEAYQFWKSHIVLEKVAAPTKEEDLWLEVKQRVQSLLHDMKEFAKQDEREDKINRLLLLGILLFVPGLVGQVFPKGSYTMSLGAMLIVLSLVAKKF